MTEVTMQERLNKIANHADNERAKEENKELERIILINDLRLKIKELRPRIENLIELHNKCVEYGVKIPQSPLGSMRHDVAKPYGYDGEFIAEGIHHQVGFIRRGSYLREEKTNFIGIENGGANGPFDLITDGNEIFGIRRENRCYRVEVTDKEYEHSIYDMKKFLKLFDSFESAFLKWIDSLD